MEREGGSDAAGGRGGRRRGRVRVTGTGRVEGRPDRLEVRVTLASLGETPGEALRAVGALQETLLALLDVRAVAAADRRTDTIAVHPHHDEKTGRPSGRHRAETAMTVRLTELAAAGDLLDAAGRRLGTALCVDGIRWSFGDAAAHLTTARRAAVEDAADRAHQLAEASGARLGRLRSITELPGSQPGGQPGGEAQPRMLAAAATVRPEPGRRALTVQVQLVYELDG